MSQVNIEGGQTSHDHLPGPCSSETRRMMGINATGRMEDKMDRRPPVGVRTLRPEDLAWMERQ